MPGKSRLAYRLSFQPKVIVRGGICTQIQAVQYHTILVHPSLRSRILSSGRYHGKVVGWRAENVGFNFGYCFVVHITCRVWGSSWGTKPFFIEHEVVSSAMDCVIGRLGVGGLETWCLVLVVALLLM